MSRIEQIRLGARACVSVIVLTVAAACGGGGGDGTGSVIQPQATIAVTAAAQSVQAGAGGVQLSAATTNSSGQVTWTLSGAGTLSASSGQTVIYIAPMPSQLGNATSATITGTVDGVHSSVTIALSAAPGSNWQTLRYPAGDLSGTRYLGGKFYAYQREALLTSTDGTHWTGVRLPAGAVGVQDITYGPQGYVAVANNSLLFSADGVNWSMATVTASNDANSLDPQYLQLWTVAAGNGVFVATGVQGIATSTDGLNWQSRKATPQNAYSEDIYQITFGAGRFVGVGFGGNYTSVDGVTWSSFAAPSVLYGVAYGNGVFVASNGFTTYTSADGLTWSTGGSVNDTTARLYEGPVSFSGGRFYAYGEKGVDSSTDGVHWTKIYTPPSPDINALLTGVASNATDTVITGWGGVLLHGVNDRNWADAGLGSNSAVNALDCASDVCVAWLANGKLLRSTDSGATWATSNPTGGVPMYTITHGNGLFVAAGSGVVYTSPDGITWTSAGIGSTSTFSASAYGAGKFVIAGSGYALFTSSDGVTWTASGTGMTPPQGYSAPYRLAYGAGRFVVTDVAGNMYTSADASQWTPGPNGSPVRSFAYGPTTGFVGVGGSGIVWHSIDGLTWSTGTTGITATLQDVAYGNSQYVAVGSGGTVLVSEDAVTWTPRAVDNQASLSTVRFTGKSFVAMGGSGAIVVSTH